MFGFEKLIVYKLGFAFHRNFDSARCILARQYFIIIAIRLCFEREFGHRPLVSFTAIVLINFVS